MTFRVKDIPFFSKLSQESVERLERISIFKNYNSDELVFYEGDEPKYIYILMDGILRMYKTNPKGQEIFIHQFTPYSMVGELANFENMRYPASAKFVTKGTILKVEYKKLEENFFKNPDVSMEIIKSLTRKLKILANLIHREMILTSDARVAQLIHKNKEIFETIKNNQIASILNITPETLSRILTKFKKDNLISMDSNHCITIHDEKKLEKLYN